MTEDDHPNGSSVRRGFCDVSLLPLDTGGKVLVEGATIPIELLHKGRPITWLQSI